jgi:excisionase family DNA binding protein
MTATETSYFSVAEVAQTLGLSEATVYRRVWDGSLPVLRLSEHGAIRIPRDAIESPARAPRTGSRPAVEPQAHGGGKREERA